MADMMVSFGEMLRSLRKERKLDLRALAERSGVEAGTISRVENARTQVTLQTCVRLCSGLEVSEFDLIKALYGKLPPHLERERFVAAGDAVPSISDVERFLAMYHDNRGRGDTWLSHLLNGLTSPVKSAGDADDTSQLFVPEDIQKLLLDTPVYHFEIHYPPAISASDILSHYKCGGMLSLTEIGEYIRQVRRQKQVTMAQLEQTVKFSSSVLSRLESGFVEQIKLADVLTLEERLGQQGILLAMYWRVFSFYERMLRRDPASADQDMKLASIFILICRWWQFMKPRDSSWREHVRSFEKLA